MRQIAAFFLILLFAASCGEPRREAVPQPEHLAARDSSSEMSLATAEERERMKELLMKEGKYDCCTRPGCTLCIGNERMCDCYLDIKKQDPICGECLERYKAGEGKLKLVSIVELENIRKKKGVR